MTNGIDLTNVMLWNDLNQNSRWDLTDTLAAGPAVFSNLSQRAGEMLKDDLDTMGPVRLAEVEEAQQAIVRAAKELEADGTITLGGKGKDDVLV